MVLFDKSRNIIFKTSILTNTPYLYNSRNKWAVALNNKNDQTSYMASNDLEFLFNQVVEYYGFKVETDLEKARSEYFPYDIIAEVKESIVLCADGKYRVWGYKDDKPFVLFDGSNKKTINYFLSIDLANVVDMRTTIDEGVLYKGVLYPSFKVFCKEMGIKETTLSGRIRKQIPLEDAVKNKKSINQIEYKGVLYNSFSELCRAYGVNSSTIKIRMKDQGMSLEQALTKTTNSINLYSYKKQKYTKKEVEKIVNKLDLNFLSVADYAKRNGYGKVLDKAIMYFLNKRETSQVVYRGKAYKTISEALRELNRKESLTTIKKRMKDYELSFEEVLDKDTRFFSGGKKIKYKDKVYYSFEELCIGENIPEGTLRKRLKKGMTLEEAIEIDRSKGFLLNKSFDYRGKHYNSLKEFYSLEPFFASARGTIQKKRKKGMTLIEALDDYEKSQKAKSVLDHLGNEYRSKKERAAAYNLNTSTVHLRLKNGWSLKDALTTPVMKD